MEMGTRWPRELERVAYVSVGVDRGVGDGVEIFGHGDGYAEVEGVAGVAVAVEDELTWDGTLGDLNCGTGGAAEGDGGGDVADGDGWDAGLRRPRQSAVDFYLAARCMH